MLMNSETAYGSVSKALHWIIALLIIGLIVVGFLMGEVDRENPLRRTLYSLHKSTGMLVLILAAFRVFWIFISKPPAIPAAVPAVMVKIHKSVVGLLYLLMLGMPLSGYFMSTFKGYAVKFYDLFSFPMIVEKSPETGKLFEQIHEIGAWVILVVVLLHLVGAIKSRIKGKGTEADLLKRLL